MANVEEGDIPYFEYEEVFKSGYVVSCWSAGNGRFHDFATQPPHVAPSFSVHIDTGTSNLRVTVHSNNLKSTLVELGLLSWDNSVMNLAVTLQGYELVSNCFAGLKTLDPDSPSYDQIPEMKLFASDFLLDGEIFKLFGYEALYENGLLNARHWRDIQNAITLRQLNDIERAAGFDDMPTNPHLASEPKSLYEEKFTTELRLAVSKGDLHMVQRLLSLKEGLVDSETLHLSLQFDHLDIFWSLMNHGACIQGICGRSEPLCTAANRGHMQVVYSLLEIGASINNAQKSTPLASAAAGGHFSIVKYLLEQGAEVNGNRDKRPIVAAAAEGHLDIVEHLINTGANLDAPSKNGHALSVAIQGGHDHVANYLLTRGASPHVKHRKVWLHTSPLYQAIVRSNFAMVETLLAAGVDPNVDLDLGENSLETAIRNGDYAMASLLRSWGASAKSVDLSSAVKAGHMPLIDMAVALATSIHGDPISLAIQHRKFNVALKIARSNLRYPEIYNATTSCIKARHLLVRSSRIGTNIWEHRIFHQIESALDRQLSSLYTTVCSNSTYQPLYSPPSYPWTIQSRLDWPSSPQSQQILTSQLRRRFKKLCRRVLAKAGRKQTSHDFAVFATSYHNPGSKFGKGMRTIRQLIGQRVPETLDQVVCCVMLADAMKMAKIREESEVTDESFDEFIQDLPRWRFLLASEDEKCLFDEIVLGVWGSKPEPRAFDGDDAMAANLEYLQVLLSNLTSETHSLLGETGNGSDSDGGHNLSFLRQAGVESDYTPSNYGGVPHEANKIFGVFEDPGPSGVETIGEQLWNSAPIEETSESQQSALMVMAGAIFGIIILFLIILRRNVLMVDELSDGIHPHNTGAGQILARNCLLLTMYLDLQKAPLPKVGYCMNGVQQNVEKISRALGQTSQTELPQLQQQVDMLSFIPETDTCDSVDGQAGLSQSTSFNESPSSDSIASEAVGDPGSSTNSRSLSGSARPVCPHPKCGKSFATISGRNKHAKFDCHWGPRVQFPCRNSGCKEQFSRQAYRGAHEKSRCKLRAGRSDVK